MAKAKRKFSAEIERHVADLRRRKRAAFLCRQGESVLRWFERHGKGFKTFKAVYKSDRKFWTDTAIAANVNDRAYHLDNVASLDMEGTGDIVKIPSKYEFLFREDLLIEDLDNAQVKFLKKLGFITTGESVLNRVVD